MTTGKWSSGIALICVAALAGCGQGEDQAEDQGPPPLQLTPGSWTTTADGVSYGDEDGALRASFSCDTDTVEYVVEIPGTLAEGARPAMVLRAGDFMHGINPVETEGSGEDGVIRGRLPVVGPLTGFLILHSEPLTVQAEGLDATQMAVDETLQQFLTDCAETTGQAGRAEEMVEQVMRNRQ